MFVAPRRKTRVLSIREVKIGGDNPISVQSMTTSDTRDPVATLAQIRKLADAGCEIVRLAVPDRVAAAALPDIVPYSPVPLVADIHFEHTLALDCPRRRHPRPPPQSRQHPQSRSTCRRSYGRRKSAGFPFGSA